MQKISKSLERTPSKKYSPTLYSVLLDQNKTIKDFMEDFAVAKIDLLGDQRFDFFLILDGHGGSEVSRFCKEIYPNYLKYFLENLSVKYSIEKALKDSVHKLVESLPEESKMNSGTTFCGILIDKNKKNYYTVNVGDSQAFSVLNKINGNNEKSFNIEKLTVDHDLKNQSEKERVLRHKGLTRERVGGQLMISRAIGDCNLIEYGLMSEPDVSCGKLQGLEYLLIGSDGVWDFIQENEIIECLKQSYKKGVHEICNKIMSFALEKSKDNLSLIVINIKPTKTIKSLKKPFISL